MDARDIWMEVFRPWLALKSLSNNLFEDLASDLLR